MFSNDAELSKSAWKMKNNEKNFDYKLLKPV